MAKISREIFRDFAEKGFFDNLRSVEEVIKKLDSRGFSIDKNKNGLVAQLLTKLCQEGVLEREKDETGKYKYRKSKNGE
jgi:DNA-binding PadR family transcriptional regulator